MASILSAMKKGERTWLLDATAANLIAVAPGCKLPLWLDRDSVRAAAQFPCEKLFGASDAVLSEADGEALLAAVRAHAAATGNDALLAIPVKELPPVEQPYELTEQDEQFWAEQERSAAAEAEAAEATKSARVKQLAATLPNVYLGDDGVLWGYDDATLDQTAATCGAVLLTGPRAGELCGREMTSHGLCASSAANHYASRGVALRVPAGLPLAAAGRAAGRPRSRAGSQSVAVAH